MKKIRFEKSSKMSRTYRIKRVYRILSRMPYDIKDDDGEWHATGIEVWDNYWRSRPIKDAFYPSNWWNEYEKGGEYAYMR